MKNGILWVTFLLLILGFAQPATAQIAPIVTFVKGTTYFGGQNSYRVGFTNSSGGSVTGVNATYSFNGTKMSVLQTGGLSCAGSVTVSATQVVITGASLPGNGNCTVDIRVQVGAVAETITENLISGTSSVGELVPGSAASFNVSRMPVSYTVVTNLDTLMPVEGSLRNFLDAMVIESSMFSCGNAPYSINFSLGGAGPHTIMPGSQLPSIACPVTIDGYSQSGATPNTSSGAGNDANIQLILNGSSCSGCNGLQINATDVTIRGLSIHSFAASGIRILGGANRAVIQGNYIGTDPGGMTAFPNDDGVRIDSSADVLIGGINPEHRNLISGNLDTAVEVSIENSTPGLIIRNNQLGSNRSGAAGIGNGGNGAYVWSNSQLLDNFVVGNYEGIYFNGPGNLARGNIVRDHTFIGITSADANNTIDANFIAYNGSDGIWVVDADTQVTANNVHNNGGFGINVWFGPTTVTGNSVYNNSSGGVNIDTTAGVQITSNYIYNNNGQPGILNNYTTHANDYSATPPSPPHDADPGFNGQQNHPEITSISHTVESTSYSGSLRTDGLGQSYLIQVFSNGTAGVREGQTLEDSFVQATDANGELSFTRPLPGIKNYLSATATRQIAPFHTSEYSPAASVAVTATMSPAEGLNFGSVPLGSTSASQQMTFTNTSGVSLTLDNFSFVGGGAGFSFPGTGTCFSASPLGAGASCTLDVTATPNALGPLSDTMYVGTTPPATRTPSFLALNVTGTAAGAPGVSLSQTSLNFGSLPTGGSAGPVPVTLTNNGTADLAITSVLLTGPAANDFSVSHNCPALLAATAQCTLQLSFTVLGSGLRTAQAEIANNAAGSPHVIDLSGTGIPPPTFAVVASPTPNDFAAGTIVNLSLRVINPVGGSTLGGINGSITYPAGWVNRAPTGPFPASGCTTSTVTGGVEGGNTVGGTGGTLGASNSCDIALVQVLAPATPGTYTFTVPPGGFSISSPFSYSNSAPVTLTVTVLPPPVVTKSFAPSSISSGGLSTLSIQVSNPAATSLNGLTVSDPYPTGLVNAAVPAVTNTCGGSVIANAGAASLTHFSGGLAAGSNCTITVQVTSSTPGNLINTISPASVTASTGSPTTSATATLTVTAALLPPTVTFAVNPTSILPGGTSTGTATLTNPNAASLTANPFTFSYLPGLVNASSPNAVSTCPGANLVATPGTGSYQQTTSFTIPAGGSCTFSSDVTTGTPGTYTGSVPAGLIQTPAGNSAASNSVTLTVGLPPPTATLSPANLGFGTVTVGTSSAPQLLTLTNTSSTTPLSITSISGGSSPFSFVAGTTCGISSLPPLGTCIINLLFTPISAGPVTGLVTVVTNAGSFTAGLAGEGVAALAANFSYSPPSLDFGTVPVGSTSTSQSVTLSNSGTAPLSLTGISADAPFGLTLGLASVPKAAGAKALAPAFECPTGPFMLGIDQQCTFTAHFTPPAAGSFTGVIMLATSGISYSIPMTGQGGPGRAIEIGPPTVDFGNVTFGQVSGLQTVTIRSIGFEPVTLTAVDLVPGIGATAAEVSDFSITHNCAILPANASCTVSLRFRPAVVGPRSADLRVRGDFDGGQRLVALDGVGTPSPVPLLSFSASRFGFGQGGLGAGRTLSMAVTNSGQLPVSIHAIYPLGDFFVQHDCPTVLPPRASCTVFPGAAPSVPGLRQGALIIESDAAGSPFQFPLDATGCRLFNIRDARLGIGSCTP